MLAKIHANWVKQWLEKDLYQQARIELNLTKREDAVQTPLRYYSQTGVESGPEIPRDKPIEEIFGEAGGYLLILGEPGSGKSTKLAELARALLDRASDDSSEPIPVILNLSYWTKNRPRWANGFSPSWCVCFYGVSRRRAPQWCKGEWKVVPLLDGMKSPPNSGRPASRPSTPVGASADCNPWPFAAVSRNTASSRRLSTSLSPLLVAHPQQIIVPNHAGVARITAAGQGGDGFAALAGHPRENGRSRAISVVAAAARPECPIRQPNEVGAADAVLHLVELPALVRRTAVRKRRDKPAGSRGCKSPTAKV